MPIKDFIHHYPRALFNDIPRVGAYFYDIPGSGRSLTTYPGQAYLKDNSLLISTPKSSVMLLIPDTDQPKTHRSILIEDACLPLVKCPRILGVYLDPSLLLNKHIHYVAVSHHCRIIKPSFSNSSAHCFSISLNIIRSSKEQGCVSWEHCNMCVVVSSAFPQAHVASPV